MNSILHGKATSIVGDFGDPEDYEHEMELCDPGTADRLRRMERIARKYLRRMEERAAYLYSDANRAYSHGHNETGAYLHGESEVCGNAAAALRDILSA